MITMEGKADSLSYKHYEEEEVDRISQLPDYLIHEILFHTDMQSAVQTSILSKRWKNIWKSLPFMFLDCFSYSDGKLHDLYDFLDISKLLERFAAFVGKVLDYHDNSDVHIQMSKMGLLIYNGDLLETLNRWILATVAHNVQGLCINLGFNYPGFDTPYEIPHQLFNCKSLKTLSIIMRGTCTSLTLPKAMSLPQIKKLYLIGISISNLELQRILSSCPVLEMVLIRGCDIQMENRRSITIDCRSFQAIQLFDNRQTVLGLADHSLNYTTTISAPNAKYLVCTGFMTEDFSLGDVSSIFSAQFMMTLRRRGGRRGGGGGGEEEEEQQEQEEQEQEEEQQQEEEEELQEEEEEQQQQEEGETAKTYSELPAEKKEVFAKRMMKFLVAVPNVRYLKVSAGFLEVLLQAPGGSSSAPTQLCNLGTMKLEMRFTRNCLRSIAYLLKISPIMRVLKLKSMESNLTDVGDDWEAGLSLTCKFYHLKFVEIREVEGCDNELKFLKFLLEKSLVLEHLIIIFRSTSGSFDREKFGRNLRELPTASSSIQMQFL